MSTKLVLIRHGESAWNNENRFTGWYDADLSDSGLKEALDAGQRLKNAKLSFEVAYTSVLKRAIKTLFYMQEALDLHWIPVERTWRLNERMYGALTGLNKAETAAKHGDEQVKVWRRSYDVAPPPVDEKSEYYPANDPKYKDVDKKLLPTTECLKDTVARVLPLWNETIVPLIKGGKKVLVVAHGNSLRALVKHLSNLSDSEIMDFNIPTGIPMVYELDANLKATKRYYLATDEEVKAAINKVEAQGKALPVKPETKSASLSKPETSPASSTAKPDAKPDATKLAGKGAAPSSAPAASPVKPGPAPPAKPTAGKGK